MEATYSAFVMLMPLLATILGACKYPAIRRLTFVDDPDIAGRVNITDRCAGLMLG